MSTPKLHNLGVDINCTICYTETMSDNDKVSLKFAHDMGEEILEILRPHCVRIEFAGSIRRRVPMVGDIEICAIPLPVPDLFGQPGEDHQLDRFDWVQIGAFVKGGHKYKQIALYSGIKLDLFVVTPPAQWGVQFLIRTGPAEFSHRLVTQKNKGGMLPSLFHVQDGAIRKGDQIIPTPEERDVFGLIGIPYIHPEDRHG